MKIRLSTLNFKDSSPSTVSPPTDINTQLFPMNVNTQPTSMNSNHSSTNVDIQPPLTNIGTRPQHANVNTQLHQCTSPSSLLLQMATPTIQLMPPPCVIQENNEEHQTDSQQQEIIDMVEAAQGLPYMDEGRISSHFRFNILETYFILAIS